MPNDRPTLVTVFLDKTKLREPSGFVKMEPPAISVMTERLEAWECRRRKPLTLSDGGVTAGGSCLLGIVALEDNLQPSAEISFHRAPGSDENWESPFTDETIRTAAPPQPRLHQVQCPRNTNGALLYFYPLLSGDADLNGRPFVHAGKFVYTMRVHVEEQEYVADGLMLIDADEQRCESECGPHFCATPSDERMKILRTMA